jgi:sirohydrochlorin cobaltochelatase
MAVETFPDAALVLFGHGSTVDDASATPVYQHVAELRRRGCFSEVREAFWKQEPRIADVIATLHTPRVFLVPLFISEGYFTEEVIPLALGFRDPGRVEFSRTQRRAAQTIFYCRPVGTDDSLTDVLLARAREIVEKFPFPRAPEPKDTTLFVAGHGTLQNDNSRKAIERQVDLVRARDLYAGVHAVFLDEEPRISDCYQIAESRNIVVVPFFISDGLHVRQDIPIMLGEPERLVQQRVRDSSPTWRNPTERKQRLVWYAHAIGSEPGIADVILERVREICETPALTEAR